MKKSVKGGLEKMLSQKKLQREAESGFLISKRVNLNFFDILSEEQR